MKQGILLLDEKDTVGVAVEDLERGTVYGILGTQSGVTAETPVAFGHKIAVKALEKSEPIVKYGEIIGYAAAPIRKGEHVHSHNMENTIG
jgi:hypothetical protein